MLAGCSVPFEEQKTIRLDDGTEIRPDFTAVGAPVLVDVHGFFWHSTPAKLQKDARRRNLVTGLGWTMLEYTWSDLKRDPAGVRAEINRVVAAAIGRTPPP